MLLFFYADKTLIDEQLLYLLMGKTFLSDVYLRFDNGDIEKISPTENGVYYQANINRDGTKVVFFGNDIGSPQVWLYDLKKKSHSVLTPKGISARHAVFSYDGKQIAFASDFGVEQEHERLEFMHGDGTPPNNMILNLFTMDLNGDHRKQITFGKYQDQRPAFSPDGKWLAFVSNRNGEERIWIVASDGLSEPRPLQQSGYGYRPWFSIDGKKIYFFTHINKRHQICSLDLQTKAIIPLKNDDQGDSHGPFVDDTHNSLLIHSNRSGKWTLFELPLNGAPSHSIQPPQFKEALHATCSINGTLAFDVPRISEFRQFASLGLQWTRSIKHAISNPNVE